MYQSFLQILQQLFQFRVVRKADTGEGPLRALHEERTQCARQYPLAGISEQRTEGGVKAPNDETMLILPLTSVGREEVTWAGNQ